MSPPQPPPLNDLEHLLAAASGLPGGAHNDPRFTAALLTQLIGVAGQLHGDRELTPYLMGGSGDHRVVAFTHPARFEHFLRSRGPSGISTQPLTGRDTFDRCVPSRIALVLNPDSSLTTEFSVARMAELLHGMAPGHAEQATVATPVVRDDGPAPRSGASPVGAPTGPQLPYRTPVHGVAPQPAPPAAARPMLMPPAYVVPGLYDRLVHYFDWLRGIDEAALVWLRHPDGREGYELLVRTRRAPADVHAHLGQALGDLQGRTLQVRIDDWQQPPWSLPVPSFYRR